MKRFSAVATLLCLAVFSFALEIEPKLLGGAVVNAELEWDAGFGERLPSEVTVQTFAFSEEPYQRVESIECSRECFKEKDSFGNAVLKFVFSPASSTEFMKVNARVSVGYEKGFREAVPGEEEKFLSPSKYVKLTEEIRTKAASIAGDGNGFEKLVKLTEWVHNSVKYEGLGYRDVILDSEQVYAVRSGKCSEFTHLLIAMLRSIGIPAKFVAGFVFSGKEWGPHAWAEVLVDGKWVPVDPTFNELGFLSAGHVKFAEGIDQDNIKEQVSAKGIGFDASTVSLKRSAKIDFVSTTNYSDLITLSLEVPNETVGEGSLETIRAAVKNRNRELAAPLSINMPREVRIASDRDRLVYLKPGEEKGIEWRVVFPTSLEEGSIYNYTVEVTSIGKKAIAYITAKKGGKAVLQQVLEIKDLRSSQSADAVTIFVVLKNTGSLPFTSASLLTTLAGAEQRRSFSIGPGEQKEFQLVFQKPEGTAADGRIKITVEGKELVQPFVINLVQQQPTPEAGLIYLAIGDKEIAISFEQALALAGGVIVLFAFLAIILRRPKKPYEESVGETRP